MFSKDNINSGRQIELDLAKAVLIFMLAFVHVCIECSSDAALSRGIPYVLDSVIGGPLGAPMFIFAMGVGLVYKKKNDPRSLFQRGLRLLGLSYLLNLCRFVIPYLIGYAITGDYDKFITMIPYRFLGTDIMQFAGMSHILIAFLFSIGLTKWTIWACSLFMSLLAQFFIGIDLKYPAWNILGGYFLGTEDKPCRVFSDFPLFHWMIVLASGYLFGCFLIRLSDKKKFYRMISPPCLFVTVLYFYYGIRHRIGMFAEGQNAYYHITTPDALISILAAIGMLGIYYEISFFLSERIKYCIYLISNNINAEYCIHWVFVVVITNLFVYCCYGTQELAVPAILGISFCISIASIILANVWKKRGKKGKVLS